MNFPTTHSPEFIRIPATPKTLTFIITFLTLSSTPTHSQSSFSSSTDHDSYSTSPESSDSVTKFQPSLAVVTGVLSIVFSISFLILIYTKCCRESSSPRHENLGNLPRTRSRMSGIDKTVIESLPFFKFSNLKGFKNGLECAICLSTFEEVEILRLLPKCKHAFHIDCIDQWLEKHSSCPLCRVKVNEDDIAIFVESSSLRFLEGEESSSRVELFIEREGSLRFGKKTTVEVEDDGGDDEESLHKFNHRIMVRGDLEPMMMLKNRWSNVSSSDLLFLKSEMITFMSSCRFDPHPCSGIAGKCSGDREMEVAAMDSGRRRLVSGFGFHPCRGVNGNCGGDRKIEVEAMESGITGLSSNRFHRHPSPEITGKCSSDRKIEVEALESGMNCLSSNRFDRHPSPEITGNCSSDRKIEVEAMESGITCLSSSRLYRHPSPEITGKCSGDRKTEVIATESGFEINGNFCSDQKIEVEAMESGITCLSSNRLDPHPSPEITGKCGGDRKIEVEAMESGGVSEMITCKSRYQFVDHPSLEIVGKCGGDRKIEVEEVETGGRRSVSEITVHPRFLGGEVREEEERLRRVWLPIARKTVQRFARKESPTGSTGQRVKIDLKLDELLDV